jgi:hypothetical protein
MEDLSTLLARLATNAENPATCKNVFLIALGTILLTYIVPVTALRRLPTVTSLVMLSISVLPRLRQSLLSHRSLWNHHCLIGLDELSITKVELVIDFLACDWK